MRKCIITVLLWTISCFSADDDPNKNPGKNRRNKYCADNFEVLGESAGRSPTPTSSKYPHEVEIIFRRKNGEVITEVVDEHSKVKLPGVAFSYDRQQMFDADKPGSQNYAKLPEELVAKAADAIAKVVDKDGIYKVVVKVDDAGNVKVLETHRLSTEMFDLQRTLQKEIRKQEEGEFGGNE